MEVVSRSVVPLVVVVLCLVQLSAQQFQLCTYTDPSSGKSYDLTALAQQFTTTSAASPQDPSGYTYFNSPCQSVVGQPRCMGGPAVCQLDFTSIHILGLLSAASVGPVTTGGEGFAVTFQPQDNRGSTINYICDASAGVGQFNWTVIPSPTDPTPYLWAFEWRTQYACPTGGGGGGGGSGSSSSGGGLGVAWILLICLVSVTLVYFAGGVVVQKFVFKKEGVEIIPNSAFWLALPGLVKDGHVFVYKSVRRLFGGGYQQF